MSDEILTIRDVAARLKLAERTVYAMAAQREMPAFKLRGHWRIRESDFERWLDKLAGSPGEQSESSRAPEGFTLIEPIHSAPKVRKRAAGRETPMSSVQLLSERLSQADLHRRFIDSLGSGMKSHSDVDQRPLEADLIPPLPSRVRVYLFNATRPPGGRPVGEHKIQLIMPGQKRGQRGAFDNSGGRIVILAGYAAEEDVFILWDAGLYADFAWSRNVQVKAETIVEASAGKLATQHRHLRPPGGRSSTETVLAASSSRLAEALQRRTQVTRERMVQA